MAKEQMRPASDKEAPDPANSYERANPSRESGMGRLDNNKSTPTNVPNKQQQTVKNRQDPMRQVNAEHPDHSMRDEEPLGEDQTPTEATDPRKKRHPRKEGKGGTK